VLLPPELEPPVLEPASLLPLDSLFEAPLDEPVSALAAFLYVSLR